jgi:hypothetical protein
VPPTQTDSTKIMSAALGSAAPTAARRSGRRPGLCWRRAFSLRALAGVAAAGERLRADGRIRTTTGLDGCHLFLLRVHCNVGASNLSAEFSNETPSSQRTTVRKSHKLRTVARNETRVSQTVTAPCAQRQLSRQADVGSDGRSVVKGQEQMFNCPQIDLFGHPTVFRAQHNPGRRIQASHRNGPRHYFRVGLAG